jgi:hypothetical protein
VGMYGHIRQITPEQLKQFQRDPESLEKFLFGAIEANAPKMLAALERVQEIARTAKASGQIEDATERERTRSLILKELMSAGAPTPGDGLSLEKSWHALHYLLTGTSQPAPSAVGNAILGGEEIGDERDYGRVRFLTTREVREVAEALAATSKEDLARHFDIEKMKAAKVIYPCRDQSEFELAQDYFEQLSDYYVDGAASGNAMLLWVE